jgi:hypothetical protein
MNNPFTKKAVKVGAGLIVLCALIIGLVASAPMPATAADPVKVIVNGTEISFPDAQPFIDSNGRTQVPVRFVAEALNAEVGWDGVARRVDIKRGRVAISMRIGVKEIVVLDVKKEMDTAPIIQNDRTFVPLRFVSEGFGSKVEWNAATRTVHITDTGKDIYMIGTFVVEIEEGDRVNTTSDGTLVVYKKSGMLLYEGTSLEGTPSTLIIDIKVDISSSDIPTQRKEAEALLKQKLSDKLVDEIMKYVSVKNSRLDELEMKIYNEGKFKIIVCYSL